MREGWKEVELEELGTIGRGKSRHRPRNADFLYGNEYPFVQTADVKAAEYKITSYSQMYSEAGLTQSKLWPINTLCITIAANIADSSILGIEACFPDSVLGFISDPLKSDVKFVKYLFDMLQIRIKQISQGAAQDNLSLEKIRTLRFTVPNVETQRKIATILSGYDDLIENNLKRIKILEEMAQQTYEEWFVRMRFPSYETAVMNEETGLPEGWEKVKLVDLCDKIFDGTHDSPKQSEFGYKLITGKHLQKGKVDFETAYFISEEDHFKIKKRSELTKGDIMYSNIGTIGNLSMVYEDFEYSCKNMIVFRPKHNLQYFVYTYLFNENTKNKIIGEASGSTQKFISLGYIRNYEDYFPSLNFITDFSEYCNPIYKKINNLNKQNQRLREARDLLLPRLMMGIVEV